MMGCRSNACETTESYQLMHTLSRKRWYLVCSVLGILSVYFGEELGVRNGMHADYMLTIPAPVSEYIYGISCRVT